MTTTTSTTTYRAVFADEYGRSYCQTRDNSVAAWVDADEHADLVAGTPGRWFVEMTTTTTTVVELARG